MYDDAYFKLHPYVFNSYPYMDKDFEDTLTFIVQNIGEKNNLSLTTQKIILINISKMLKSYSKCVKTTEKELCIHEEKNIMYTYDLNKDILVILEKMFRDYELKEKDYLNSKLKNIGNYDLNKLITEYPNIDINIIRDFIIESKNEEDIKEKLNNLNKKEKILTK